MHSNNFYIHIHSLSFSTLNTDTQDIDLSQRISLEGEKAYKLKEHFNLKPLLES